MSPVLANPTEMVRRGAPRPIHSDEELAEYTAALFDLTKKADPTADEQTAIELLTLLIDRYECNRYSVPDAKPTDVLRFLLQRNGLAQRDLTEELGSESTASLVLSGKRQLTRNQIARLSRRFNVSPEVFFELHSPQQGKPSNFNADLFIERRDHGVYAVKKSGSQRASAILPTQAKAIERARNMSPDATIHVQRVRRIDGGDRDKWRSL